MPAKKTAPVTSSRTAGDAAAKPKSKAMPNPHAGHQKPPASKAAAEPRTPTPPAKGSDTHAAHTEAADPKKERDPVNGLTVDPSTAPKTMQQGRTYYFSSEQSLKQFLENPAKFVKPAKK
jgi:YHS domain-containing protein